ncbi:MAG TPA: NfeD family protein [Planctomycetota bacterium]|jgi:membrane-bound serine protease (ClpP class)|nr:NfeD family protein [Planctomycetota bacterium]
MILATALLLVPAPPVPRQEPGEPSVSAPVYFVPIEGELDTAMLSLVRRGVSSAREAGAAAVVFEIDTPGGEFELMWKIARAIGPPNDLKAGVPTVAFVTGHAWSAGALIALSCAKIYATRAASIGAAMPVQPGPTGIQPLDEGIRPKITSALRAEFRAWADAGGRNPRLAEAMVDPDLELLEVEVDGERRILTREEVEVLPERGTRVRILKTLCAKGEILSLTAPEALRLDFISGIVADREGLLQVLGVPGAAVVQVRASWAEAFVRFLAVAGPLLFIAGCVLAYIEMKVPGFGVPGLLAIVSFGLLLFGNYLAGLADAFDLLLVLAGFAFLAIELFLLPGSLVFGILGALCVVAGLLLSFQNFGVPRFPMDWAVLRKNTGTLALSMVGVGVGVWAVARFLPSVPVLRRLVLMPPSSLTGTAAIGEAAAAGLLGAEGVAVTDLRPAGKVEASGRLLDAQTTGGFLGRGSRVRIVEVSGNRVLVEGIA